MAFLLQKWYSTKNTLTEISLTQPEVNIICSKNSIKLLYRMLNHPTKLHKEIFSGLRVIVFTRSEVKVPNVIWCTTCCKCGKRPVCVWYVCV